MAILTESSLERDKSISRWLAAVLRHHPEHWGICLDRQGYASVEAILSTCPYSITLEDLIRVAHGGDKQRFFISDDHRYIRAYQGHTVPVDISYSPSIPPEILYHGTSLDRVDSILRDGLLAGSRRYVHMTEDIDLALEVGRRHGSPVCLTIEAYEAYQDGYQFYLSENGVWLYHGDISSHYINCPVRSTSSM